MGYNGRGGKVAGVKSNGRGCVMMLMLKLEKMATMKDEIS
jgi:hypothetical protein